MFAINLEYVAITYLNARGVLAAYNQRLSRSYDAYKPVTCLLRFSHHDCTAPKPGCAHPLVRAPGARTAAPNFKICRNGATMHVDVGGS